MINIGDRVSGTDLTVPIGTSIEDGGVWTREVDGWHSGRTHYNQPRSAHITGTVVGLVPYVETLEMHKQRFAVTCLTMGQLAGGGSYLDGARDILRDLSLPDPARERLRVGSWVSYAVNAGQVPEGSVLLSGARDRAEGHSLFVKRVGRNYTHLWGPRIDADRILTQVVALPAGYETTDWPEPAEDEQDLIRQFRIRSWDVGFAVKESRGWCGEFESNISVLGLSSHVARALRDEGPVTVPNPAPSGLAVGAQCTVDLMDAAPVGTIVTEGPGHFTATKGDDGWRVWATNGLVTPSSLFFHAGLTFHTVPEVASGFTYGQRLTTPEQQSCALGAVFAYPGEGMTEYLMGRTDDGGMHGTRNIQTPPVAAHWGGGHRLIWDGSSPIHEVPVRDHEEMRRMPVGTVVGQDWIGTEFRLTWVKDEFDHWSPITSGRRGASDTFTIAPLRYVYIPVPGVPRPTDAPVPPALNEDDEVEDTDPF